MSQSAPQRAGGQSPSNTDLPYGPLPVRGDQSSGGRPGPSQQDPVTRLSGLDTESPDTGGVAEREPDRATGEGTAGAGSEAQGVDATGEGADRPTVEPPQETSSELDVAIDRGEADDDVHFGVAAKALGVSRKTVERMVKRGQLERGPSKAPATVSKRALVTVLEQRRRDVSHLTRTTGLTPGQPSYASPDAPWPEDAMTQLQEVLRPVLQPLLEDFVAARTRVAVLESQMESIAARSAQERARDELLLSLATGGWRERRRARRMALRQYVLRDEIGP
jgi:hypothetical protein